MRRRRVQQGDGFRLRRPRQVHDRHGADATGCVNDQRTGYDSILCRLETPDPLGGAPSDQTSAKLKTKLTKRVTKPGDKKILVAQASTKCAKSKRIPQERREAVQGPAGDGDAARRQADRSDARGGFARVAGEAAGKTDTVRTGLGC